MGNPNAAGSRNALTASGEKVGRRDADVVRRVAQTWQARSFSYYDQLGEIKYAAQFYSRALANLRLFPAEVDESGDVVETTDAKQVALLDRIQDPGGGRSGLLAAYGRLMFLTGEALLFVSRDPDTDQEQWEMLSSDELRIQDGVYQRVKAPSLLAESYREPSDDDYVPVDDSEAVVYRLWQRHPRYSMLADATMQGVLDLCEELVILTHAVRSRARSRLAGSGILAVSDGFSTVPLEPHGDEDAELDPFVADLVQAMTTAIVDEGSASAVVPLVVRGPLDQIKEGIRHIQISDPTQLYPETGLRYECIKRIAIGLDMPVEILMGLGDSNHWCADDATEILTADGWKLHGDVADGDEALTLNHETGMAEWKPIDDVARFDVQDLPMLSIESRFHSSLTTLNHRWPVLKMTGRNAKWERAWTHSDEIRTTHRLVTAAPSADALTPQWVRHDDALVELVAWLWTEGQIRLRPGRRTPVVAIYQSHTANPANVLRIRAALTSLYGVGALVPMTPDRRSAEWSPPRWRETQQGGKTVFSLNRAAAARLLEHVDHDRIVSTNFVRTLTVAQLALFIETSTRGDGHTMPSGTHLVGQSDAKRLFPLELAAILLGRSPSSYSQTHEGFKEHEQHYVSVSTRSTVRLKKKHLREARYTGTIWCPVTENSTWLARRNGKVFYTGNSAWQIDEQTWKSHLQPKAQQLVDDLTSSYYRPTLRKMGVEDWATRSIGYDATAIINHPDRTKDAKDLYEKRAIGKRALRAAGGFDEEDAPTTEELAEMVGVAVRDSSLAWYGIPSVRGGNVETAPGVVEGAAPGDGQSEVPSTGAEVEPGPAASPSGGERAEPISSVVGAGEPVARILGAADLGILRAREVAGNRLKSLAKRDRDCLDLIEGVPARQVAHVLGAERAAALGAPPPIVLVSGARELVTDALRMQDVTGALAERVADSVEVWAARTLFEERPGGLPASVGNLVAHAGERQAVPA